MNNIQQAILLGDFDAGASQLVFDKDISNLAKPSIKGRAFMKNGKNIYEVQTYFTEPEQDWVFDEDLEMTYSNPVYLEQCRRKGKEPDFSGFIDFQQNIEEVSEVEEKEQPKIVETVKETELEVEDDIDLNDLFEDEEDFEDDEIEEEEVIEETVTKPRFKLNPPAKKTFKLSK